MIVVIGAGFAGLSTAYHLAKGGAGDIVVLEQDKKAGGRASGNNAGMIRQAVPDALLAGLAVEGCRGLGKLPRRGWKGLRFRHCGSLLIAKRKDSAELGRIARTLEKKSVRVWWLAREAAARLVPLLRRGDFDEALFCPSDAMLDIKALLRGFLRELKKCRVRVIFGRKIRAIRRRKQGFVVEASGLEYSAQKVVNAAGAWAEDVGRLAGGTRIRFHAYRRHLFESGPVRPFDKRWPFVWDLTHQFYFRPLERSLLWSPCDKDLFRLKEGEEGNADAAVDPRMRGVLFRKLKRFSKDFPLPSVRKRRAGLRTMAPDGRFVVGEDPRLRNFFWVAGLGGHGVTTCLSVGKLAADIILGKGADNKLVHALSPKRFV